MASDLTARCDRALRRAVTLANDFGAELHILTVIEEMFEPAVTRRNAELAESALAAQIRTVCDVKEPKLSRHVVVGVDYEDIIRTAADIDADLIVLGIQRHTKRELFQGTTTERVVRHGTTPVLIVKKPVSAPYQRIVVANDLSHQAEAALGAAIQLAPSGQLVLLHAVSTRYAGFLGPSDQKALIYEQRERATVALNEQLARLAHKMDGQSPTIELSFAEGEAYEAITEQVTLQKPDLLAIGTHGRSGLAHALIGSVAEQILADCPIDVLVAKA